MEKKGKKYLICGGITKSGKDVTQFLAIDGNHCIAVGKFKKEIRKEDSESIQYIDCDFNDKVSVQNLCQILEKEEIDTCVFLQRSKSTDILESLNVGVKTSVEIIDSIKICLSKKKGNILFVGSILGQMIDLEQTLSYHILKASLHALIKYKACELAEYDIRVNLINLSTLRHTENSKLYDAGLFMGEFSKRVVPLKREVTSKDLADVIELLSNQKFKMITGESINLDGGLNNMSQRATVGKWIREQR